MSGNVYFDLTRVFNERGPIVALSSGPAVVYYRIAIMSKDGDWVIRETTAACTRVLDVLAERGASYRPGAPLDPRWLAGGWSSHFEYFDDKGRRVRCDFFSRPPRVHAGAIDRLFARARDPLLVVEVESLIRMKRTQRAKDYAVIGELATRLPPEQELLLTTDPDRLLTLATEAGPTVQRPAVRAAVNGDRDGVVVALAREQDSQRRSDAARMEAYAAAAGPYLDAFSRLSAAERRPLMPTHRSSDSPNSSFRPPSRSRDQPMQMLSEDDRDLHDLSDDELALAWDLWFDLAQATNDVDPPCTHGVFQMVRSGSGRPAEPRGRRDEEGNDGAPIR